MLDKVVGSRYVSLNDIVLHHEQDHIIHENESFWSRKNPHGKLEIIARHPFQVSSRCWEQPRLVAASFLALDGDVAFLRLKRINASPWLNVE